jgi:VWFA-related protein
MRYASIMFLFFCLAAEGAQAQQSDLDQTTLMVHSTLVEAPVLVKTGDGRIVYELTAGDFTVTDNGVPQDPMLELDTDAQPLALAIVVETGGAGARHLENYRRLGTVLEALIGNVDHRIAVVGFDSTPHLLMPFAPYTADASEELSNLHEGDGGAAILDALTFAVTELGAQPARYRRAILLLSETIDQGSKTTLNDALRVIGDTNTTMFSFGFSSTHAAISHEAAKFNRPDEPGPKNGCFSREGADAEYEGHYSRQVLDCISTLAPPVRLATMAFLASRNALRTNTAESVAELTGGQFLPFHNGRDLKAGLIAVSNDVPNRYVLSFRPAHPTPGLHSLHVEIKNRPELVVKSRTEYWIDSESGR